MKSECTYLQEQPQRKEHRQDADREDGVREILEDPGPDSELFRGLRHQVSDIGFPDLFSRRLRWRQYTAVFIGRV